MNFEFDWFSHNIGNWQKWLSRYVGKPVHALEIGCFEGRATTWLLANVLTHPESTITCIDTFEGSDEHREFGVPFTTVKDRFYDNIKDWQKQVRVFIGQSSDLIRRAVASPLSIVYVDGSHRAADVLIDAGLTWPLITPGGIVIFDDYQWDHYPDPTQNPRLGIDAFLSVFAGQFDLIAKEYQVAISKRVGIVPS